MAAQVEEWTRKEAGAVCRFIEEVLHVTSDAVARQLKRISDTPIDEHDAFSARTVLILWIMKRLASSYSHLLEGSSQPLSIALAEL
jgi:hypothetical protein